MYTSIIIATCIFIVHVESIYIANKGYHTGVSDGRLPIKYLTAVNQTSDEIHKILGDLKTRLCTIQVTDETQNQFTHDILKYRYNFVHFTLNFLNFSVNETKMVITKNNWIWTYKGESGANQYLNLPGDFGYLSFGLLWAHTLREKFPVNITKRGDCSNLTIGLKETDLLIGQALGNMTSQIASQYDMYNSSYWCYNKRSWIDSTFLYSACKSAICTIQTMEYSCCKFFIDFTEKTRTVRCDTEHYKFGTLWWILPTITGEICFAFYPLLLTKLGMNVKKLSKRIQKERSRSLSSDVYSETIPLDKTDDNENRNTFISSNDNPITFLSTLCSPLFSLDLNGPIMARALRMWIIILPLTLSTIHVVIDYIYAKDFIIDAVQKGALLGFSTIIAGPSEARRQFLYLFGGPIVAMTIYLSFGFILIVFPSNLEGFIATGLPTRVKMFIFLTRMPLKLKERLSGVSVKHHKGYQKLHNLFLAQICVLLNMHFWAYSIKMFYLRWKNLIFPTMADKLHSVFAAIVSSILCLPLYVIFCAVELLFCLFNYAFPVINCFFIVLKSFLIHYTTFFQDRGCIMQCLKYSLCLPMLILFCISWYMYCVLFFDGFWFLSKIVMFTYSGIIAYPKLSYGYLVLVFMAFYYLTESFNAFGDSYRELLKLSIEACEKLQQKSLDGSDMDQEGIKGIRIKYGIKCDLFYLIVDRHLPRRNQVLITMLRFTSVITVLTISVELLIAFDKFQELSLVTHVFTALFICALPKIIKTMCLQKNRDRKHGEIQQKLLRTINDYVHNRNINSSDDDTESSLLLRSSDYGTFQGTDFQQ